MPEELSGLKIDLCCVLCKSLPASDLPLFEMQNRFFICGRCVLQQEHQGKTLKGSDGLPIIVAAPIRPLLEFPAQITENQTTRSDDTIFGILELSSDATEDEVIEAIDRKMRYWISQPRSKERERMRERLEEWREEIINNPQFLAEQRPHQEIIALPTLTIAGQEASSLNDFVVLCEQSEAGWLDGEKHLRERDLEYWVFALTKDDALDKMISAASAMSSTFCALNNVLYLLAPQRPFRLYEQDRWQALETLQSASSTMQLAMVCELSWSTTLHHLYAGSLLTWLESAQNHTELHAWYATSIAHYGQQEYPYQSLGLELLLEKVVPNLLTPEFVVAFDGIYNTYTLSQWDSEIAHRPIIVTINNKTRGAALLSLTLEPPQSNAGVIALQNTPSHPLYIRPGEQNPLTVSMLLQNLKQLNYGKSYHCVLHIAQHTTISQPPILHKYGITLHTMAYRQGFRRYLWLWGLRGGFPSLLLNAVAGATSCLMILLLLSTFAHIPPTHNLFLDNVIQALIIGTHRITAQTPGAPKLILLISALIGSIGGLIGLKRGHANYSVTRNMHDFTLMGRIYMLLFFCGLVLWTWNYPFPGSPPLLADSGWQRFAHIGGSFLISVLILISIYVISFIRSLVEWLLRRYYHRLLTPQGS